MGVYKYQFWSIQCYKLKLVIIVPNFSVFTLNMIQNKTKVVKVTSYHIKILIYSLSSRGLSSSFISLYQKDSFFYFNIRRILEQSFTQTVV